MMAEPKSGRKQDKRPHNLEVEDENLRKPRKEGEPPRPATEPVGTKETVRSDELLNDPGSGERLHDPGELRRR